MPKIIKAKNQLAANQLCATCDSSIFDFKTTKDLKLHDDLIGQERALGAIRMAAKIRHEDFNLFVLGKSGSGRHNAVKKIFQQEAGNKPVPNDWVYVNNFDVPHKPIAIELPPGLAIRLKMAMETLVDDLANNIPALFDSEDYRTQRRHIDQEFDDQNEQSFSQLGKNARKRDIAILRTPMGFAVAAIHKGETIKPEDYNALAKDKRQQIDNNVAVTQKELEAILKLVPNREKERRQSVEILNVRMAEQGVGDSIVEVEDEFKSFKPVTKYLASVRADLIQNADIFLDSEPTQQAGAFPVATSKHYTKPRFYRYTVNVVVSNDPSNEAVAPIVVADLPTLANLIGRVEHVSEMGALTTNFTMIKPGALHLANGGYLILNAREVLTEPFAWDALKRCLESGNISIVSAGEKLGFITTVSLEPDPIPLNVRVVLVGDRMLYYLLASLDLDFQRLFKLQADFNDAGERNDETMQFFASMIGSIAQRNNLRALNPKGVARLLQEGSRLVDDTKKLSLNLGELSDILREADYWTAEAGRKVINSHDIDKAINEKDKRASRIRELSQEAITRGTILIETDGFEIGQINALSILQIGSYRFGRPSRVTAKVRMGTGKVIDIEREVELGGSIHSKGVMILSSYLATNYALNVPMSLWASIAFEQSYGGVDGDSASAAELFALLSALSQLPIDQSLAVTGSINQRGQIQAIGGINEKIEGFYDVCLARNLTGQQGILMPVSNVKNLMLRSRVVESVKKNRFKVIAIETIDQGMEILTGCKAGVRNKNGEFPKESVNGLVESRLREFANRRVVFAKSADSKDIEDRRKSS
ncbi:MAG: AAA family ATPase [Hyphomicrobiales bacterium]|nr:AAA family ATPase [Hyphomicrobiales bacterium]